ncbi:MAG: acetyl-CoA carboxylase biotin carboxyl carrier protein [Halanaerobiaceae bacterium]|nr:acetyl-CoA carboxylase biotin carboxyl carrier protein [Halanaerobiaceae bacterium]
MNLEEIKLLIDILKGTDVTELELKNGDSKIRIRRGCQGVDTPPFETGQVQAQKQKASENIKEEKRYEEIAAPMVGTFYRAPSPESRPYVEVGDIVNPGDVLCIIEAMKLMNEIEVETRGKIIDILVANGEPVEYGEPLFIIEPL